MTNVTYEQVKLNVFREIAHSNDERVQYDYKFKHIQLFLLRGIFNNNYFSNFQQNRFTFKY